MLTPAQVRPPKGKGPTEGPAAGALARPLLGLDLLPWQRYVLNRGLERAGDRWRWRTVVVTLARQNGKSALLRALIAHRMIRGQTVGALSQIRAVGRETMFDPLADAFTARGRGDLFDTRAIRANGSESVTLRGTGGRLVMPSSSERGAHGYSLDLAVVDEAWALSDYRVPSGIQPTQIAMPDPQLWVVSTAGTANSLWLRELVDAGRAGDTERLALFEWAAAPELDPADVAGWAQANPALGQTVTADELGHAYSMATTPDSRAEFERAHLNRWTARVEALLPAQSWRACCRPDVTVGAELVFGFDVALDRSRGSIVAAALVGDAVAVELVDHRPGVDWLPGALADLRRRWSPRAIVGNDAGPARSLVDAMEAAGAPVEKYGTSDYTAACQTFYDLVMEKRLAHRGQAELDAAAAAVGRRRAGESWAFGRAVSSADISALTAATLAAHRASRPHIVPRLIVG